MPTYDQSELQKLIRQYQNDMMKQYAATAPKTESASAPVVAEPSVPTTRAVKNEETDIGSLQVRVSTENRAVPLAGAVVTVTRDDDTSQTLVRTMITDQSGLTPLIDLVTKERALSLSPGNEQPFSVYSIEVAADGYYPKKYTDLPIYGGVTAVQSVSMVPLPEGGSNDTLLVYPQGAPSIT